MAKILIADDDKVMRDLLITLLDLEGDQGIPVSKPEEVEPVTRQEDPDLILMDVHLSGGDALPALRALKADSGLCDIPVLMTSGMDVERECLDAGADGFIMKPFRPDDLLKRIKDFLEV